MRGMHGAKPYATAAGANSISGQSATMEATCLEAAAAVETTTAGVPATATTKTTTKSSTSAAVPSRPCYGTERHGCDANEQINYLFYFHALKFDRATLDSYRASAGFWDATGDVLTALSLGIES